MQSRVLNQTLQTYSVKADPGMRIKGANQIICFSRTSPYNGKSIGN